MLLAPKLASRLIGDLESKLQRKLHDSSSALRLNLAEVVNRVLRVVETTSRVAHARHARAVTARTIDSAIAGRLERQEDVASRRVCGSHVDLRRIRLVEDIE